MDQYIANDMEILPPEFLRIEIKNTKPIELTSLIDSLSGISSQYVQYCNNNGLVKEQKKAKLYVKEIKKGSIIFDLIEFASASVLPILDGANTIVGFAEYVKLSLSGILNKDKSVDCESKLTNNDCKDLISIIRPIAQDHGSILSIGTYNHTENIYNVYQSVDYKSANAIENILEKNIADNKKSLESKPHEKVFMVLYQTRNANSTSKKGNKAIIADLDENPISIYFENDSIKEEILSSDKNPYNFGYVIDVKPEVVQDKIVAYKIINLHQKVVL